MMIKLSWPWMCCQQSFCKFIRASCSEFKAMGQEKHPSRYLWLFLSRFWIHHLWSCCSTVSTLQCGGLHCEKLSHIISFFFFYLSSRCFSIPRSPCSPHPSIFFKSQLSTAWCTLRRVRTWWWRVLISLLSHVFSSISSLISFPFHSCSSTSLFFS